MPWLLMTWHHKKPGHQQQWYWSWIFQPWYQKGWFLYIWNCRLCFYETVFCFFFFWFFFQWLKYFLAKKFWCLWRTFVPFSCVVMAIGKLKWKKKIETKKGYAWFYKFVPLWNFSRMGHFPEWSLVWYSVSWLFHNKCIQYGNVRGKLWNDVIRSACYGNGVLF